MRRRGLLLLAALPGAASAQTPNNRRPAPGARPAQRPPAAPAAPEPPPALPAPPPAPPPPPPALNEPPVPLAPGLSTLPAGGWRLRFAVDSAAIDPADAASLRLIAVRLRERSAGRVTLFAEASGGMDLSSTRRIALERARAVKAELESGGLDGRRVDIRALGRTPLGADVVDLLPPTTARS